MAIIAFWSDEEKETGQTMSMVALTTYMAMEHNYKIIDVSTSFKDSTLEDSYFNTERVDSLVKNLMQNQNQVNIESGVEGLVKLINSNKTSTSIVSNYTKIVYRDRLDILCAPRTEKYEEYRQIAEMYPTVLQTANRSYDLVFVDVSKRMPQEQVKQILELADVIVVNITQRLETINEFMKLREENEFFSKNNILINMGRYDKYSKYNIKNVSRYMREKKDVHAIPYNTLFFEACSEAKVAELFLRFRKLDEEDRNAIFISEINRLTKDLIYKLQELQLRA